MITKTNIIKNLKGIFLYGKARVVVTVYTNAIAYLFVDIFNISYWKFAVVFVPLQFILDYFINKFVFNKIK